MDSISFKANYLNQVTIAKRTTNKYKPYVATLVEMDYMNPKDVEAIHKTASDWEDSLTVFVSSDMKNAQIKGTKNPFHVYAITTQKTDFENIKYKKILGITQISETESKNSYKIDVLQTNPDYMYDKTTTAMRDYKNVGKQLIESLKEKYGTKPIFVYPTKSATGFYQKQGFQPNGNNFMILI